MVRRQADIFFVLFILALAGVFVLIAQQNTMMTAFEEDRDAFAAGFIPKMRIETLSDTLEWFVVSGDSMRQHGRSVAPFSTTLFIPNVELEDDVTVRVLDIYRDGVRMADRGFLSPGTRIEASAMGQRGVLIPLLAHFDSTGAYSVYLSVSGSRFQVHGKSITYHGTVIDTSLLPMRRRTYLESGETRLTILVREADPNPDIPGPGLSSSTTVIHSIQGFVDTLNVSVTGFQEGDQVALLRAPMGSALTRTVQGVMRVSLPIQAARDTVVLVAHRQVREDYWKVSTLSVPVEATPAVLRNEAPLLATINEQAVLDLSVEGVPEPQRIAWDVFFRSGDRDVVIAAGTGPRVSFYAASEYEHKALCIRLRMHGQSLPFGSTWGGVRRDGIVPVVLQPRSYRIRIQSNNVVSEDIRFSILRQDEAGDHAESVEVSSITATLLSEGLSYTLYVFADGRGMYHIDKRSLQSILKPGASALVTIRYGKAQARRIFSRPK